MHDLGAALVLLKPVIGGIAAAVSAIDLAGSVMLDCMLPLRPTTVYRRNHAT